VRSLLVLLAGAILSCPPQVALGQEAEVPDIWTVEGSLTSGLPKRENGASYQDHQFRVDAQAELVVRLTSQDFDTYLILRSPTGVEHVNDDFDGVTTSQLTVWAMETGLWTLRATSFGASEVGAYTLMADLGPSVDANILQGRLDPLDEQLPKGEVVDRLSISLEEGAFLYAELYSLGFDGFLSIRDPQGVFHRNDDALAGDTTLSRLGPMALPGEYQISITSIRRESYGAYDLRLIRVGPDYESPAVAQDIEGRPLEKGMRVVRGPSWEWADQDGNGTGTVGQEGTPGWWSVVWDAGGRNSYRWGIDGIFDLSVISPVDPTTVRPGDQVLIRADIAELAPDDPVSAFASHLAEVLAAADGELTLRLPDGTDAIVQPLWVESVSGQD
jgi:Mib_herc2